MSFLTGHITQEVDVCPEEAILWLNMSEIYEQAVVIPIFHLISENKNVKLALILTW